MASALHFKQVTCYRQQNPESVLFLKELEGSAQSEKAEDFEVDQEIQRRLRPA